MVGVKVDFDVGMYVLVGAALGDLVGLAVGARELGAYWNMKLITHCNINGGVSDLRCRFA